MKMKFYYLFVDILTSLMRDASPSDLSKPTHESAAWASDLFLKSLTFICQNETKDDERSVTESVVTQCSH